LKSLRPAPLKFVNFDFINSFCLLSDFRRLIYILSFVLIFAPSLAGAAQVNLSWKGSTGAVGYKMHYGNYSGSYQYTVNVGKSTSCTISGLTDGKTYYFAATAYGSQQNNSGYSNEVSYKVGTKPTPPAGCVLNSKFKTSTIRVGEDYYTDRSYTITGGMPSWMVGRNMIRTVNDERLNKASSGYLRFSNPVDWYVYVLFDSRASNVPDWLDKGGWERKSEYKVYTSLSSQPYLQVWKKRFPAGGCVDLGGNYGPGSSTENRSNFVVVYGKSTKPPAGSGCVLNSKFQTSTIRVGEDYYTDRSYAITGGIPSWMVGRKMIRTSNDERLNKASSGYLRFSNPVDWYVYVLFDSRASNVPDWLDKGGWERKSEYRVYSSLSSQPYLQVWKKRFPAGGCVDLGGNYGPGSSTENRSNFVVVYGK
jgi:hypothetical protein